MKIKWSENKKIKVIALQGPSTAGKTYLSNKLKEFFTNLDKKVMVISLDDYYIPKPKNAKIYDFDNPAALNWQQIIQLLQDINDFKPILKTYKYSFEGSKSVGPIFIDNPYPEFLIIDGIYSLYLFSNIFFDLKRYDPQKETLPLFIQNNLIFDNFSVINILMTTCKKRMYEIRLKRDLSERGKDKSTILFQLDKQTWPATEKWVYNNLLKVDILFWHGSFNEMRIESFFSALKSYIKNEKISAIQTKSYFCSVCGKSENDYNFNLKRY
ncbi:Uridine-cytidine kinase B [Dictyocoela muelleri]|nr:Uridine-cytidine kinase B [Dictyocoela muelleri]